MRCDHKLEVIDTNPRPLTTLTTSPVPHVGGMDIDLAFGGLVVARLLLSLVSLLDQLEYDHLLSSPLTSNLRRNHLPLAPGPERS